MSKPKGFYRRGGKTHPIMGKSGRRRAHLPGGKPTKTMFGPPKDKTIARMVRGDTPEHARESVKELKEKFENSKTYEEKEHLWRSTQLEANRLEVLAERKRPGGGHWESSKEREDTLDAQKTFQDAADWMWQRLPND